MRPARVRAHCFLKVLFSRVWLLALQDAQEYETGTGEAQAVGWCGWQGCTNRMLQTWRSRRTEQAVRFHATCCSGHASCFKPAHVFTRSPLCPAADPGIRIDRLQWFPLLNCISPRTQLHLPTCPVHLQTWRSASRRTEEFIEI